MSDSKSSRLPWILALCAVAALAWGWYHEASQRHQDMAVLRKQLVALQAPANRQDATTTANDGDDYAQRQAFAQRAADRLNAADAIGARPVSPEQYAREQARIRAQLEARFATDGSDPAWAQATEGKAVAAIAEPALAAFEASPSPEQVRCARSMCRLVFTFDTASQADDWALYYPVALAQGLPVMQSVRERLPDGRVRLVMYGFRDPAAKLVR